MRKLWLDILKPFSTNQLIKFGLEEERFKDLPRLNFLVTVCCSLVNFFHPGFKPLFMTSPNSQIRLSSVIMKRLVLENPLLHPEIWPINLKPASNDSSWTELTFADMERRGFLDFPQLTQQDLVPHVFEIASGVSAIIQANSSLTYMGQLQLKGQNLTRQETEAALQEPPNEWKLKCVDLCAPSSFQSTEENPRWIPNW